MKKWLLLLLYLPQFVFGQSYHTIGNGSSSYNWYPFYGLYDYSHNMFIYNQNDLGSNGKEIFEISFELFGYADNYEFNGITIKLAHTTDDVFASNTSVDLSNINYTDLTTCIELYDLTISSNGWVQIPFSSTFYYNGVDNLLVIIENHDGEWDSGFGSAYCEYKNEYVSWYKYADNFYPNGTGTRDKYIPNIKFGHFDFNPLPITLNHFSAELKENTTAPEVELNWSTSSEKDNSHFTIWRSEDGLIWLPLTQIPGSVNSNEQVKYNYTDRTIPQYIINQGVAYYKLSQTDYDGTTEYFNIIPIQFTISDEFIIRKTNLIGQDIDSEYKGMILEVWNNGHTTASYQY